MQHYLGLVVIMKLYQARRDGTPRNRSEIYIHAAPEDDWWYVWLNSLGTAATATATATAALKIKCQSDECRFGLGRTIRHEIIYMAEPPNDETY